MKRTAIFLSALLVPGLALAGEHEGKEGKDMEQSSYGEEQQQEQTDYGTTQQDETKYGTQPQAEHAQMGEEMGQQEQQTERISGEVKKVDLADGTLKITTDDPEKGELTLHGTPDQLRQYEKGQRADVEVRSFGDNQWLKADDQASAATAMAGETVQGRVESVDKNTGEVKLSEGDPKDFRANPQSLENLQPGQQVSVTFEKVDGKNWASQIKQDQASQEGMEQPAESGSQEWEMEGESDYETEEKTE